MKFCFIRCREDEIGIRQWVKDEHCYVLQITKQRRYKCSVVVLMRGVMLIRMCRMEILEWNGLVILVGLVRGGRGSDGMVVLCF